MTTMLMVMIGSVSSRLFRVNFPAHAGFCFRGCGHPHSHHDNCRLSAAQVGTDSLALLFMYTNSVQKNIQALLHKRWQLQRARCWQNQQQIVAEQLLVN